MALLDSAMRTLGQTLVPQFGKDGTITREDGSYDPSTRSVSSSTTDYSATGVVEDFPTHLVDGDQVQHGDIRWTVNAKGLSITPEPTSDTVTLGSETFSLVRVNAVYSGDNVALWELHLRR